MNRSAHVLLLGLALSACSTDRPSAGAEPAGSINPESAASASPAQALHGDAAAAVQRFGSQLKAELQQAMAAGGPLQAVEVCQQRAPALADAVSAQTGFQLARVSLRHRNPERGRPTDWQRSVLESFDQQLASGQPPGELMFSAMTAGEYRFMKAIPTAPLCLTCHGTALAPELEAKLARLYPKDRATGYQAGELRGAFVAVRPLDP